MSLTGSVLYTSDLLSLRHVACRPAEHERGPSAIEEQPTDSLVLPLRGAFLKHVSPRSQILAEPSQALFFTAGRPYRISHPIAGDDCLSLELGGDAWREVLGTAAGVEDLRSTALAAHGPLAAPAMAARHLLWRRIVGGLADPLEIEETSLALLAAALRAARREEKPLPPRADPALRRQQIEAAKIALLAAPDEGWTLTALARRVYTSPFHLAHAFRAEEGVAVHQYHLRTRLARALDLLLDSDRDLSAIAFDLGFASHSHFTAVFRQRVGLAPSALRRSARSREVKEARKILTALPAGRR
jgi:AraC family transcriptional regulator